MVFQTQYNKTPLTVHEHNKPNVVPLGNSNRIVGKKNLKKNENQLNMNRQRLIYVLKSVFVNYFSITQLQITRIIFGTSQMFLRLSSLL